MSHRLPFHPSSVAVAALLLAGTSSSFAQSTGLPVERVVVTGAVRAQALADAPYAADVITGEELRESGALVNLSDALARVPGLVANNRSNHAQDLQLSTRGFGARAPFGVRGIRIYADGIPATMPDGQGQLAHVDLANAERIEVLRGPFSALYGNASGGVIAIFGAPVQARAVELAADVGSFGHRQLRATVQAPLGEGFDVRASVSQFEWDGFRPQQEARRTLGHVRLGWQGAQDKVVVLLGSQAQRAQDPQGLTPEAFAADPRSTAQPALDYNARKTIRQVQGGASWQHRFAAGGPLVDSQVAVYHGTRGVTQWQTIPPAAQAAPTHSGGVIDFDRTFQGLDARLSWRLGAGELVTGVALEQQADDRRGHANFTGPANARVLGVTGVLRRDERNKARTEEAYAQLRWPLTPELEGHLGARAGRLTMSTTDQFLSNGDDSGSRRFDHVNPVAGLGWKLGGGWMLHASVARGQESPTLTELAYAPNGAAGFNPGLKPQKSQQAELGAKWRDGARSLAVTAFAARTDDEIGVLSSAGGRTIYQNVGRTKRQGVEAQGRWRFSPQWEAAAALTWLDATYRDPFGPTTALVAAGNRIAGTPQASGFAELVWSPVADWGRFAVEWRGVSKVYANDTNTVAAPGYGLVNLRWSKRVEFGGQAVEVLARVDNVADRTHVGSVIVNEGNGRFFETGVPRSALLALRWRW